MAPSKTTTLRVPTELRDQIARLADLRGMSMVDLVSEAIHRLGRDEWWQTVHTALDEFSPEEVATYLQESERLDGAAADGL